MRRFKVTFKCGTVREYTAMSARALRRHLDRWFSDYTMRVAS